MLWSNVTTFMEEKDILPPSYWKFYSFLFPRIECLVYPNPGLKAPLRSWSVDGNLSRHHLYWRIVFQICYERIPILSYTAFTAMEQSVATGSLADFYPGGKLKLWKGLNMGGKLKKPLVSLLGCAESLAQGLYCYFLLESLGLGDAF